MLSDASSSSTDDWEIDPNSPESSERPILLALLSVPACRERLERATSNRVTRKGEAVKSIPAYKSVSYEDMARYTGMGRETVRETAAKALLKMRVALAQEILNTTEDHD